MTFEERIAALEMTQQIILARLDAQGATQIVPVLPGTEPHEKKDEPVFQDPSEFFWSLFGLPEGEMITVSEFGTLTVETHFGVKLLAWDSPHIDGIQYLGIGAAMASHRGKYKEAFDALFVPECGERWHHNFVQHPNQTGLTSYGTGVPHAFPCGMRKWKKPI